MLVVVEGPKIIGGNLLVLIKKKNVYPYAGLPSFHDPIKPRSNIKLLLSAYPFYRFNLLAHESTASLTEQNRR